jgi:hypothetical protein
VHLCIEASRNFAGCGGHIKLNILQLQGSSLSRVSFPQVFRVSQELSEINFWIVETSQSAGKVTTMFTNI